MACESETVTDLLVAADYSADAPPQSLAPQFRAFAEGQRQVASVLAPQFRAFAEGQRQVASVLAPQFRAFAEGQRQVASVLPSLRSSGAFAEGQRQVASVLAPQFRAFAEGQRQVASVLAPQFRAFAEGQRQVASVLAPQFRAFAEGQRQVASVLAPQFRAFAEGQRQVASVLAPQFRAFAEGQRQVASVLAPQFRAFAEDQRQVASVLAPQFRAFAEDQRQVASVLAPQFRAFAEDQRQVASVLAPQFRAFAEDQRQVASVLAPQFRAFAEDQRQVASVLVRLPKIDLRWIEALDRLIPSNLRGLRQLGAVASTALDEGLPLSWIPRREIVVALVEADGPRARRLILSEFRNDILDDCEAALAASGHELAVQCRFAISALRHGHFAPAQSHAANIVDSIVHAFAPSVSRSQLVERSRRDFNEVPLRLAAPYLTLRPLDRAFVQWRPSSGKPPPTHFARHPTAHAVGHPGVFDPTHALIAVMLAVSLTVQFAPSAAARAAG